MLFVQEEDDTMDDIIGEEVVSDDKVVALEEIPQLSLHALEGTFNY